MTDVPVSHVPLRAKRNADPFIVYKLVQKRSHRSNSINIAISIFIVGYTPRGWRERGESLPASEAPFRLSY